MGNWSREWEKILGDFRCPGENEKGFSEVLSGLSSIEEVLEAFLWMEYNRPEYMKWINELAIEGTQDLDITEEQKMVVGEKFNNTFKTVFGEKNIDIGTGQAASFRQWSRDWNKFDWKELEARIATVPEEVEAGDSIDYAKYIGLTAEELQEYMIWLRMNHPEQYDSYFRLAVICEELGISQEELIELKESGLLEQMLFEDYDDFEEDE